MVYLLAHFCTAMSDEDGAIMIDMYECAGLVEEDGRE